MNQQIYIFENIEDAIFRLEKFGNTFKFPITSYQKLDIIRKSVSSNVFRAFQLSENKPSVIFRSWAEDEFDHIINELQIINYQNEFDDFIIKKTNSLLNFWTEEVLDCSQLLIYGPAIKMVNLLIKTIQESKYYRQDRLIKYQHIPFDSFSLKPLIYIINEITNTNYRISIPSNVSMKFVNCPQIYCILMDSIKNITKKAKISPIIYDYWSWNDKHNKY